MKIVQSSWACNRKDPLQFSAGWYSPEYKLIAWALSCLQIRKYYDQVSLYADTVTAKMLIDRLKLPYTEVLCDLDQYNHLPPSLWGLTKIHAYSKQAAPFLHIDGDVFIWKAFDDRLLKGGLIAQNLEFGTSRYETLFAELEGQLIKSSEDILGEKGKSKIIYAYNAGILGGNDLSFFNLYTTKAIELISGNTKILSQINIQAFNIYFEQYLFYCLSTKMNKKVNVLFDEIIPDNEYRGFGDFLSVPHEKQYLHLIGNEYKMNQQMCQDMANRLRQDYPEYYYRIIALFKKDKLPLTNDYYYFIDEPTEKSLFARYQNLKSQYPGPKSDNHKIEDSVLPATCINDFHIADNISAFIQREKLDNEKQHKYDAILSHAREFENQLITIIENKFSKSSKDALYTRDILYTQYFEILFANTNIGYDRRVIADRGIEIMECSFDWSIFDMQNVNVKHVPNNLIDFPGSVYMCVIPECNLKRYSLLKMDELDLGLLKIWEDPTSIAETLKIVKSAFDPDDLQNSLPEFELLISGRIKKMLAAKIIKVAG